MGMHLHTRRSIALQLALVFPSVARFMAAYAQKQAVPAMAGAAKAFLDSLWKEQREKATFKLEDDEHSTWFYTPVPRKGLPLREMTSGQRQLALALLSAGLSQNGLAKSTTIMSLEDVLASMESNGVNRRDPDGYFFSVFGDPSEKGAWGYRVEGHHLSLHFNIRDGHLSGAPSFFGTNPAKVLEGRRKGLRVLSREEDLGRDLIQALNPEQRKTAVVLAAAPRDILSEHSRQAALIGEPNGIQISALNAAQGDTLQTLLHEYCDNMTDEIAGFRRDQIRKVGNHLWFAWAGGIQPGEPHYYRIQSPEFLVEFDDTQDHANHIHSVWRDFRGDFGRDLLAEHYQDSHHHRVRA
ncbi:MAG TPA: hypothetical protein DEQ47_10385 [Solibacterales bacterium]|jgi:hypothetical protein|nr:hypothetical protein [Bryobacterales bacterium]